MYISSKQNTRRATFHQSKDGRDVSTPTFGIYKLHVYISTMNLNISHIYILQEMQQLPLE